jgi:hypothetical protein
MLKLTEIRQVAHSNGREVVFTDNTDDLRRAAFEKAEEMNKHDQVNLPGDEWLSKEGWLK